MSTLTPTTNQINITDETLRAPQEKEALFTSSFFKNAVSRRLTTVGQTIPILSHACKSIVFPPSLTNSLAEKLGDIDRALELACFYQKIQKTVSIEDQSLLKDWLLKYCQVLGRLASKNEHLLEELDSPAFQTSNFKSQLIEFLSGMDREIPIQKEAKRIAILYTGLGGGGHTAPAIAIKELLTRQQYAVKMIDIDKIENEFEPKILGRGHEDIWTEFYQRKGLPTLANFMWKLHHLLYLPEWRKTTQVIRDQLAVFNPVLIFAVADHKPQLANLAYSLNRKMVFVHTDNKFSSKLAEIVRIQTIFGKALITFTKPTIAEPASYDKTLPKISGIRNQLIDLQIPVRQGFKKISRREQYALKKEMGIDPATKVCLIMMGNNGVENEMRSILKKLYEERLDAKNQLHLIFVCGKNQALATELTSHKSSFNGTAITIEVRGFVEGPQMVKVAQSADVWISKMGGSSSAEALAARKYVLSVSIPSHKWEDRNALANQSCGLSSPLKQDEKILPQIDTACKKTLLTRYIPDWKQQLMQILTKP